MSVSTCSERGSLGSAASGCSAYSVHLYQTNETEGPVSHRQSWTPARAPRPRRGCAACKRRHVKCDEAKPACRQCAKNGLACEDYSNLIYERAFENRLERRKRARPWETTRNADLDFSEHLPPLPLSWATNTGPPAETKAYVQTCDRCRENKTTCDNGASRCIWCMFAGADCIRGTEAQLSAHATSDVQSGSNNNSRDCHQGSSARAGSSDEADLCENSSVNESDILANSSDDDELDAQDNENTHEKEGSSIYERKKKLWTQFAAIVETVEQQQLLESKRICMTASQYPLSDKVHPAEPASPDHSQCSAACSSSEGSKVSSRLNTIASLCSVILSEALARNVILHYRNYRGFKTCTGGVSNSNEPGNQAIEETTTGNSISATRKRQRSKDQDDGEGSDQEGTNPPAAGRQRAEPGKTKLFACPYYKYDPPRYSIRNEEEKGYRTCAGKYLPNISRVKQHLKRVHKPPNEYCGNCYEVFNTREERLLHDRRRVCIPCPPKYEEMMTDTQEAAICNGRMLNTKESWHSIFRILFPDAMQPISPYASKADPASVQQFVSFFHRIGPSLFDALLSEWRGELMNAMDPSVQDNVQEIVDEALETALRLGFGPTEPADASSEPTDSLSEPKQSSPASGMALNEQYTISIEAIKDNSKWEQDSLALLSDLNEEDGLSLQDNDFGSFTIDPSQISSEYTSRALDVALRSSEQGLEPLSLGSDRATFEDPWSDPMSEFQWSTT